MQHCSIETVHPEISIVESHNTHRHTHDAAAGRAVSVCSAVSMAETRAQTRSMAALKPGPTALPPPPLCHVTCCRWAAKGSGWGDAVCGVAALEGGGSGLLLDLLRKSTGVPSAGGAPPPFSAASSSPADVANVSAATGNAGDGAAVEAAREGVWVADSGVKYTSPPLLWLRGCDRVRARSVSTRLRRRSNWRRGRAEKRAVKRTASQRKQAAFSGLHLQQVAGARSGSCCSHGKRSTSCDGWIAPAGW